MLLMRKWQVQQITDETHSSGHYVAWLTSVTADGSFHRLALWNESEQQVLYGEEEDYLRGCRLNSPSEEDGWFYYVEGPDTVSTLPKETILVVHESDLKDIRDVHQPEFTQFLRELHNSLLGGCN